MYMKTISCVAVAILFILRGRRHREGVGLFRSSLCTGSPVEDGAKRKRQEKGGPFSAHFARRFLWEPARRLIPEHLWLGPRRIPLTEICTDTPGTKHVENTCCVNMSLFTHQLCLEIDFV